MATSGGKHLCRIVCIKKNVLLVQQFSVCLLVAVVQEGILSQSYNMQLDQFVFVNCMALEAHCNIQYFFMNGLVLCYKWNYCP